MDIGYISGVGEVWNTFTFQIIIKILEQTDLRRWLVMMMSANLLRHRSGSSLTGLQIVASSEALRKWNTPA